MHGFNLLILESTFKSLPYFICFFMVQTVQLLNSILNACLSGHCCRNPTLTKCEDETHTLKVGDLESSGTPENSEFECRAQNISHWNVLGIIGKFLKHRCPKWPRMSHLDGSQIGNLTTDQAKLGINPIPTCDAGVRHGVEKLSRRATRLVQTSSRSEVRARSYDGPKSQESKLGQFRDFTLGVPGQRATWVWARWSNAGNTMWGEGGGFPRVRAVVSQVSPRSPVACPNTKRVHNEF
jgi:hypothetical protein